MTLENFKAFIEGFEHAFENGAPSAEQWEVIKDKLHQVSAAPTTPIKRDILDDLVDRGPSKIGEPWVPSPRYWGKSVNPNILVRECSTMLTGESG